MDSVSAVLTPIACFYYVALRVSCWTLTTAGCHGDSGSFLNRIVSPFFNGGRGLLVLLKYFFCCCCCSPRMVRNVVRSMVAG